jgi:uncharacterized membrane protein YidH (DUF202 family)
MDGKPGLDVSTDLSARRTGMSFQRTRMSADRTLMSVMRTSLVLLGLVMLGLGIGHHVKFMVELRGLRAQMKQDGLVRRDLVSILGNARRCTTTVRDRAVRDREHGIQRRAVSLTAPTTPQKVNTTPIAGPEMVMSYMKKSSPLPSS